MLHLTDHMIPGLISIDYLVPEYPCIVVTNKHATARIALHGAHVIDFIPADEKPVIFTSSDAVFKEGKAIRGGIPVCWPWFNAHPTDPELPSHGYARIAFWQLFRSFDSEDFTTLVFTFSKEGLHAELTLEIGRELSLSLKTINTGDSSVLVGGALHSYFLVSDIEDIYVAGLEGTTFHDSLTGLAKVENETITFSEEIDRVYQNTNQEVVLHDKQWKREICIAKTGSKSTVVWNPWIEKSASMGDLGNEDYKNFVCIETANALEDVYHVGPGKAHTLTTTISVSSS